MRKPLLESLLVAFGLLCASALVAQTVTGTVVDDTGEPLIGATVLKKGSTVGTITDLNGGYSIAADVGDALVFSYVGYTTQEIVVTNTTMDVVLGTNANVMDEVVVVGYGKQRREAVTGAISTVDGGKVRELTVSNLGEALQGRLAGVNVVNQGQPGAEPIIEVRGIGSISFATGPLVVVDGIPLDGGGGLNSFDSRDVENITVLKDPSSTAVYGSRAANGVLLITTKDGKGRDGVHVSLESTVGVQTQNNRLDLLNTDQYIEYAEIYLDGGVTRDLDQVVPGQGEGSTQTYRQTNTDWQDAVFQTGLLTQNSINVSGDNGVSNFYTSFGYLQQEGVIIGSPYERFNFRLNSDHELGGGFSVGQNLTLVQDQRDIETFIGGRNNLFQAWQSIPYQPVRDDRNVGGFSGAEQGLDSADPGNPVAAANLLTNQDQVTRLIGNVYADYAFLDGFNARAMYGVNASSFRNNQQIPIYESTLSTQFNFVSQARARTYDPILSAQLGYAKIFDDHSIDVLLVGERQTFNDDGSNIQGQLTTNDFSTLNGAEEINGNTFETKRVLQSQVARLNYGYQGKYLVSFSARRDQNSALAPGNNEETFFAGALGWRVSEETFMADSPFSELKLRASYGEVGNDFNRLYSFQPLINQTSNGVTLGNGAQSTIARISSLANANLSWEVTTMLNVGVDFGFMNNRLNFTAEYYNREVDNLIDEVRLPTSTGFGGTIANIGALSNSGYEFQANYFAKTTGDFNWNVSANISRATNEVTRLADEDRFIETGNLGELLTGNFGTSITRPGDPIGSFYGFVVDGLITSEEDLMNGPVQEEGTQVGDFRYADINGRDENGELTGMPDGVINGDDRTIIGSYQPDFIYAANFSATYKALDLSLFIQGSQGNDIYNAAKALTFQTGRLFNIAEERFTNAYSPTNTNTDIPAIYADDPNNNSRTSSFFVEDGSYLRLKNLTIGYTVDLPFISDDSKVRLYGSTQNLFTITGYSGLDPEIGGGVLARGVDFGVYPQGRTFLVGAQVGF